MSRFEFPGQNRIMEQIKKLIDQDCFPHTILLTGVNGSPLLAFAIQIAKLLLTKSLDGYELTIADKKIEQLIHPDLNFSFPVKGSKTNSDHFITEFRKLVQQSPFVLLDDWANQIAASSGNLSINVKECNSLLHKLSLKSFEGGSKILLIWGAESLGINGNRLLKLLEEPPSDTYIILVTENQERILPTILSRCQVFRLKPTVQSELSDWLVAKYGQDSERAKEISQLSEGSICAAVRTIFDTPIEPEMSFEDWLLVIVRSDFDGILAQSDQFRSLDKEAQKYFLMTCLTKLRQAYFFPNSYKRIFEKLNHDLFDLDFVENTSLVLNEMMGNLDRNAHSSMLFTASSLKIWRWLRSR